MGSVHHVGLPRTSALQPDSGWELAALFRDHNAALLRFLRKHIGPEQDASDIAQDAYMHLLRLRPTTTVKHYRAFLFKTAANLAIDGGRQRARRGHIRPLDENTDNGTFELSPERHLSGEQELAVAGRALAELPPKCRLAFLLLRVYDLSVEDIANSMGIGECMVRRYVARALDHIRGAVDGGRPGI